jgi:two-component system chemotaxis response regulator CheY
LILEDSPEWAALYKNLMELINASVFIATDGLQGLELLGKMPTPDLILLDYEMPVMNGLEFYNALQHTSVYDRIKIILTSQSPQASQLANKLRLCAHIPKSSPVSELLTGVKQALGL